MISNYNLDCGYHNFELKDKIYLVPDWALKVIYTDGYNEVVYQGDSSNVTLLEGHEITFQEEASFDERFKFSKVLSLKVNGYKTFNDLNYRYCAIIETKDGEFYIVNVDFPSFVTHTYTLNASTNETELVFSSQSNIATLKLTNFEPNNVNSCNEYSTPKVKKFKLTESWASSLSTWQKSLVNKGTFSDIEPLQDSISLTEEFDGEKYTVTLGFDIPMSHFKNDWHIKLLQFEENKYRGYIQLEGGTLVFVGYNVGLFPSYSINGDIISIRLQEVAIRGIAYGNDYAVIDTDIPNSIELSGATCKNYNFESTCNWEVESKPDYITIEPMSGKAGSNYVLEICNTDEETGYAVSEFVIRSCNARTSAEVIIKNPMYRWVDTNDTMCVKEYEYEKEYLTFVALEDNAVFTTYFGMEYSLDDGRTWNSISASASTPAISSGETIMWRNYPYYPSNNIARFYSESKFDVQGNVLSIMYGDNFEGQTSFRFGNANDTYANLFSGCTGLTNAENLILPVTNVNAHFAYAWMFSGCESLITAPSLPATEIWPHAYLAMFANCTSLIEPPAINATSVSSGSCEDMFKGCTSLITAPILPATGMAFNCYAGMFWDCTSMTTVPSNMLPALDLVDGCYQYMFSGCTSLESAPDLPATGLTEHCYAFMFKGCSSLTSVPVLPATTLYPTCYYSMFEDCTSLEYVPMDMLPATYLRQECYETMFRNCTSLKTAPIINDYTFPNSENNSERGFFVGMFSGCTSLNYIISPTETSSSRRFYLTTNWVNNVAPTGIFIKKAGEDWGDCSANGIPCGWEVYDYGTFRKTSGTPYCTGQDQYVDVYDQVSSDYGVTWETTATTAELLDECAPVCGCYKILMYGINDDDSISGAVQCNNSTSLSYYEVNSIAGDNTLVPLSGYQHVIIGTCCTKIGHWAFCEAYDTQITRRTIEDFENFDRITVIDEYGMAQLRGLKSIDISNVTSLGFGAFSCCFSLSSVTIPSAISLISADAFEKCSGLTSVTIEDGVETIGGGAFEYCTGLSSITIPTSVTAIGDSAFAYCSGLTDITIPSSITEVNSYAFYGCSGLTSAYLPSSVSKIHYDAFTNCPNMESITIDRMTPPTLVCKYSYQSGQSCGWWSAPIIYVPAAAVNTYKNATGYWAFYHDDIRPIPT